MRDDSSSGKRTTSSMSILEIVRALARNHLLERTKSGRISDNQASNSSENGDSKEETFKVGSEDIADCAEVPEWAISYEFKSGRLKEVLEIALYSCPMPDEQNMRWDASRVQLNIIPRTGPQIASARQKIMSLIRPVQLNLHLLQRKVNESGLTVMRVEVDHDNDQVLFVR